MAVKGFINGAPVKDSKKEEPFDDGVQEMSISSARNGVTATHRNAPKKSKSGAQQYDPGESHVFTSPSALAKHVHKIFSKKGK